MSIVVPAVLPASREELEEKLTLFTRIPSVSRIQIDVVDERFAPHASWPYTDSAGSPQAAQEEFQDMVERGKMLPSLDRIEYEIDLMCFDALIVAQSWLTLGASRLTFHTESAIDFPEFLASARKRYGTGDGFASGLVSFGLALNIDSSFAHIKPCIEEVNYVQFMGIAKIGRQGEPFDERVLKKIETFHKMYPAMPIQVDGGVSLQNAKKLLALDVSRIIVGSALTRARDPMKAFAAFEALQNPYSV